MLKDGYVIRCVEGEYASMVVSSKTVFEEEQSHAQSNENNCMVEYDDCVCVVSKKNVLCFSSTVNNQVIHIIMVLTFG